MNKWLWQQGTQRAVEACWTVFYRGGVWVMLLYVWILRCHLFGGYRGLPRLEAHGKKPGHYMASKRRFYLANLVAGLSTNLTRYP